MYLLDVQFQFMMNPEVLVRFGDIIGDPSLLNCMLLVLLYIMWKPTRRIRTLKSTSIPY